MDEIYEKQEIKKWLIQKNDINITNFEFIDSLFEDVLIFIDKNKLILKDTEDFTKMKFIRFLFNNTNISIR